MVVNYDIPLLNERAKADDEPDVETYLHRIGVFPALYHSLSLTLTLVLVRV
jgi:hypothetical protein